MPGSYLFLRANADVPRGTSASSSCFPRDANGVNLHNGKYFDYVGEDSSNQNGIPTSQLPNTFGRILISLSLLYTKNDTALLQHHIGSLMPLMDLIQNIVKNGRRTISIHQLSKLESE